jgi:hypothetical protein
MSRGLVQPRRVGLGLRQEVWPSSTDPAICWDSQPRVPDDAMSDQMWSMNMTGDPAWSALVDSVRQDLVHMPEMSAPELKTFMPAHQARVTRLMQMHRSMMAKPKT